MSETERYSDGKPMHGGDPHDGDAPIMHSLPVSQAYEGLAPWAGRAVLLVDLDAFFASVEQLDHPGWRGKPVIVGGDAKRHGVVSTASYEARAFGVRSAMPASQAARLCPDAIWAPSRFSRYRAVSNAVMGILREETPVVEQVSIDEAFLDVSPTRTNREHPLAIARRVQRRVEDLGVTCSIGVGATKTVAKIASDMDKPRGITVVFPGTERDFLAPLPVRSMSGIGKAAEEALKSKGIETLGQLIEAGPARLERLFGKNGLVMYARASGCDEAPSSVSAPVKSVSSETTFSEPLTKRIDIDAAISTMAAKVGRRCRSKGIAGSTITLKIRFHDRAVRSVRKKLPNPTDDELLFSPILHSMLAEVWNPGTPVILVGVAVGSFACEMVVQDALFDVRDAAPIDDDAKPVIADEAKRRRLLGAADAVRDRFGEGSLHYGHELRNAGNTTGTSAKNPTDYR